jgi:hypothetical protein
VRSAEQGVRITEDRILLRSAQEYLTVVIIGGQTLALLLTLVGTPVAYSIFDDWENSLLWARLRGLVPSKSKGRAPAPAA